MGHTAWAPEGRKGRSQAGPKGRDLEVGAQRASRLLVKRNTKEIFSKEEFFCSWLFGGMRRSMGGCRCAESHQYLPWEPTTNFPQRRRRANPKGIRWWGIQDIGALPENRDQAFSIWKLGSGVLASSFKIWKIQQIVCFIPCLLSSSTYRGCSCH